LNEILLTEAENDVARAARHAGGVHHVLPETALVEVSGADAGRYLDAMCTKDLSGLDPGGLRYAALLDDLAQYLADFWIWRVGEAWWLEVESALAASLAERLTNFAVADDAEAAVLEGMTLFHVEGDKAPSVAVAILGTSLTRDAVGRGSPGSKAIAWARRSRFGHEGFTLACEGEAPATWTAVAEEGGLASASWPVQECLRIDSGHCRGGIDMTTKNLLPEIGLWGAVSLDKGCFPGQEIIRRVISRGEVKRRLVAFGEEVLQAGRMDERDYKAKLRPTSMARRSPTGPRFGLGWLAAPHAARRTPVYVHMDDTDSGMFLGRVAALPLSPGPLGVPPDVPGEREEKTAPR
jgi:folate-binding protein YgfZ